MYATTRLRSLLDNDTLKYYSGEIYEARPVEGTSLFVLYNDNCEEIIVDGYDFEELEEE